MIAPLPSEASLGKLLTSLFDLPTQAKPSKTEGAQDGVLAVFINDAGLPAAYCAVDWSATIALSTALAHIPPAVAADIRKSRKIEDHLVENLREVLNIVCSLFNFNDKEYEHVRLGPLHLPGDVAFAGIAAQVAKLPQKAHFVVSPKGYGEGTMSLGLA